MKKKERYFNATEKKILRVLYKQKIPLTIYEIADECGISYQTAKKYLKNLLKEDVVDEVIFKYEKKKKKN